MFPSEEMLRVRRSGRRNLMYCMRKSASADGRGEGDESEGEADNVDG